MTLPGMIGGFAVFGVVASLWGYIKSLFHKFYNLFVIEMEVQDKDLVQAVGFLVTTEFKNSGLGARLFRGDVQYVRSKKLNSVVGYECMPVTFTLYWRGKLPILVWSSRWWDEMKIQAPRLFFNVDDFIVEACNKLSVFRQNREMGGRYEVSWHHGSLGDGDGIKVLGKMAQKGGDDKGDGGGGHDTTSGGKNRCDWRPVGYSREDLGEPSDRQASEALVLNDECQSAMDEAKKWRARESWFKARGLPWRRGWLLHGKPGTGKTSLVRAMAQELDLPVHCLDLASMTNVDFAGAWGSVLSSVPAVALIEDIDAVFDGRKNISCGEMEHGISFDFLLNVIDGIQNSDGVFLVVTTNHPEKVCEALGVSTLGVSSRPGRVDRIIEMPLLEDIGDKEKIARRLLKGIDIEHWHDLLDSRIETGAQFQERCVRRAVELMTVQEEDLMDGEDQFIL